MNQEDATELAIRIKNMWPRWHQNPDQVAILWAMFGNFDYPDVERAFWQHRLDDPEDPRNRRPNFRQVQRDLVAATREGLPPDQHWSWGEESELAYLQERYVRNRQPLPGDAWIIRQLMGREPPTDLKRDQVRDAMQKHFRETGQPATIAEVRAKQAAQMQNPRRAVTNPKPENRSEPCTNSPDGT